MTINTQTPPNTAGIAFARLPASTLTPLLVCQNLDASALLESALLEQGKGRFSIIIANEAFRVVREGDENLFKSSLESKSLGENSFLDALECYRARAPKAPAELADIPLPLGGCGYLGWEFFSQIERVEFTKKPHYNAPVCAFIFGRDFVIFDHFFECVYAVSVAYDGENVDIDAQNDALVKRLKTINQPVNQTTNPGVKTLSCDDKLEFCGIVDTLKREIYKGNLLQCVPSRSVRLRSELPPLLAYANLRRANPSPYMYYFNFGEFVVIGSSPEVLLKAKSTSEQTTLTLRPIAGTRPRGKNALDDAALEAELKANIKENAEHLMLLDLGRNDIGRVAKIGSVKITAEKIVEKYARVMHLVSEVQGELACSKHDALKAAFPAGTVSGAPKIQAIATIEALEPHGRGIYAGAIGYFAANGDFDFAIAIRTAVWQGGVYHLQAGAGVVFDSDAEAEFIETQNKMRSLLDAIIGAEFETQNPGVKTNDFAN